MSLNTWSFTGRLGRDSELKTLPSGAQLLEFSVAVDVGYGEKKKTIWPKCTQFGVRVERLAQYLLKGQQVAISGEVDLREWTDRDGAMKLSLEVRVNSIDIIGGNGRQEPVAPTANKTTPRRPTFPTAGIEDDIPF